MENIVNTYFGKKFTKAKQILFARWLLSPSNSKEKEQELKRIWDESPSLATLSTYHDWKQIQNSINKRKKYSINWMRYAAIASIILLALAIPLTLHFNGKAGTDNINFTEVFVAYGESQQVVLPDSSTVWVNAGSVIIYPQKFDDLDKRTIYLTGEASFNVKKDPTKSFTVKTAHLNVEALGTVFTVQAFPTESYTSATLETGSVHVDILENKDASAILQPSQQLVYSHADKSVKINSIDSSMFDMARRGYLIFESTPFPELIRTLERRYNVVIHYNKQEYANNLYNVKFAPSESIEDVLSVLKKLTNLEFKIEDNKVYIN